MRSVPPAEAGFSPLDEELKLLPYAFSPSLVESATRLATWMPFERASKELAYFSKVVVADSTVRRMAEQAGEAYVELQTTAVEKLEREAPEPAAGPERQLLSVDGAMVPLVKGEWAEVKTLVVGKIGAPVLEKGEPVVHARELSYFSRLTDADTFTRLATVETQRRGTERAREVGAVMDGAEWEQGFVDVQRPDAKRVLDWGHGAEYVTAAGKALFGEGTAEVSEWLGVQLHELRRGEPEAVLKELGKRQEELAAAGEEKAEALEVVSRSLQYLEKRREQIRYAEFAAQGWPIGSGAVESGNKLVVEARLKGAGMRWERENVNPMLALRNIACSDRWEEAWPQISERVREQRRERSGKRRSSRLEEQKAQAKAVLEARPGELVAVGQPVEKAAVLAEKPVQTGSRRPAANHPWRHMPIGKAIFSDPRQPASAKT